ncbi:Aspartate aminotransferase, mitochondrial [Vanrija pseudolonga]|uniref:Aspartate aminotransferase n=1 Tax=Vanrija pseudolonga TaxID=143232 RepID=A0AAF1BGP7_9TREE|nr:Aspartate aminotransferase, mitochondrial [Vanrija pseudolonga]
MAAPSSPPVAFANTPEPIADAIFALTEAYNADPNPDKINLGQGAYKDNTGSPWILPSVRGAEAKLAQHPPGHEYLHRFGHAAFRRLSAEVAFGAGSRVLAEGRVASLQTISGSGAVHLAAAFLHTLYPNSLVYVPDPSWSNHRVMFEAAGFAVRDYAYYDPQARSIAFDALLADLRAAPAGSIVVLHACAHNPTGCDLTPAQWSDVASVLRDRGHIPVVDSAYQGFASGDLDADAHAIRLLLDELALPGVLCQSFSKSMGLYGERAGAIHVVVHGIAEPAAVVARIEGQIAWIARKEYTTPARYGAELVTAVLSDPGLYAQWREDLVTMSTRLRTMRAAIQANLRELRAPADDNWDHVTTQIGMFWFSGLSRPQALWLRRERHVYLAESGRVSLTGVNEGNVRRLCEAIRDAVEQVK